jgi:hypothetical protein
MTNINELSITSGNTLEIHYWLDNNSHSMDANIQNRCEYEILGILKEIALIFETDILIETEPFGEGGLKRWLKVVLKDENKKAVISSAAIIALITVLITTPITRLSEKFIDKAFEDKELRQLEKDKLRLEIEKLKIEIGPQSDSLISNNLIRKRKSNFYESLENYPKINSVTFISTDENKTNTYQEKTINKQEFKKYILTSDDLEPVENENSIIEIISPVLKKGNYRWMGIYNGETIPFNMQSTEFKTLVQTGMIEFKNGSSINCFLQIRKKVDNEGIVKVVGYDVIRVNHYFENDTPIETPEGKKHRQKKEGDKQQLTLFNPDSENIPE